MGGWLAKNLWIDIQLSPPSWPLKVPSTTLYKEGGVWQDTSHTGQVPSMLHMVFDKYDELEDSVGRKDGAWEERVPPGNTRIFLFYVELEGYPPNIPRNSRPYTRVLWCDNDG